MLWHKQNQSHLSRIKNHENNLSISSTDWSITSNDSEYDTFDLVKHDPLYIAVPLTILYSFILITGIIGNVVTCVVILRNKYLHTTTNYYLFSLAISDLLLLTFGLPQEMYYIWSRYPYIFGETFCILRGLMAETSTNASVLTITAFTVERYLAICHPFLARTMSDLFRVIKYIVTIWIIALFSAIPQAMQFGVVSQGSPELMVCTLKHELFPNSFEISTLFFFILPMIAITILYIRIGIKLKRSAGLKHRRISKTMLSATNQQNSSRSLIGSGQTSRKVLKMLVAVVITFFVCWAPFHIQRLVAMHIRTPAANKIYDVVTYISAILYYTSSTVNPILYHTMSHKFRDAFKDTARSLCGKHQGNNGVPYLYDETKRTRIFYKDGRKFKMITCKNSDSSFSSGRSAKFICQAVNEITNKDDDRGQKIKECNVDHV